MGSAGEMGAPRLRGGSSRVSRQRAAGRRNQRSAPRLPIHSFIITVPQVGTALVAYNDLVYPSQGRTIL